MPHLESYALPGLVLLLKATYLLLVALAASQLLQRASAGSRHLVWLVALVGLLVLPAVAAWGPLPIRVLPSQVGDLTTADVPLRAAKEDLGPTHEAPVAEARSSLGAPAEAPATVPVALEPSPAPNAGSPVG